MSEVDFPQSYIRKMRVLESEQQWLEWDHPNPIIRLLSDRVSDRKARLFEVACLRRLSHWSPVKDRWWAVEVIERQADGIAGTDEARAAFHELCQLCDDATSVMGGMYNQFFFDWEVLHPGAWDNALRVCESMDIAAGMMVREETGMETDRPSEEQRQPEQLAQCALLRCIFGNPFRPVAVDSRWLSHNVTALAQAIYTDRAFNRMPILADALEDAGCTNADMLNHCRQPPPTEHVRGCWVVDLVLGKS